MELVSVNGIKYAPSDAKISVFDRGFLYGDLCCESMRTYDGKIFRFDEHLDRLENSLFTLKFPAVDFAALKEQVLELLLESEMARATVRISISRGTCSDGFRSIAGLEPNVVIIIKEFKPLPYDYTSVGIAAVTGMIRRLSAQSWPLNVKNTNLNNVLASLEAIDARAYETVMINADGYLTEGSASNIFWIKEDRLYTPADYLGILPGITRAVVLELAAKLGLNSYQGEYFTDELAEADEAFITNSLVEILPLISFDGKQISGGSVGRFTSLFKEAYHNLVVT